VHVIDHPEWPGLYGGRSSWRGARAPRRLRRIPSRRRTHRQQRPGSSARTIGRSHLTIECQRVSGHGLAAGSRQSSSSCTTTRMRDPAGTACEIESQAEIFECRMNGKNCEPRTANDVIARCCRGLRLSSVSSRGRRINCAGDRPRSAVPYRRFLRPLHGHRAIIGRRCVLCHDEPSRQPSLSPRRWRP
jgi:hypothetical protein